MIGPIVEPHGMLLRDTNTCHGTPARSHACWNSAAVAAEVAYRWLELILIAGPALASGR